MGNRWHREEETLRHRWEQSGQSGLSELPLQSQMYWGWNIPGDVQRPTELLVQWSWAVRLYPKIWWTVFVSSSWASVLECWQNSSPQAEGDQLLHQESIDHSNRPDFQDVCFSVRELNHRRFHNVAAREVSPHKTFLFFRRGRSRREKWGGDCNHHFYYSLLNYWV